MNDQQRIAESVAKKHAMEIKERLRQIKEEFPDNPKGMDYFYQVFEEKYLTGKSPNPNNKPKVGTMCVQVPEELIYAVGAIPERLCNGSYTYDQVGAEFLPTHSCSLVKASLGHLSLTENTEYPMIVIPTTCDQKKKSGQLLEGMGHHPYMLEMPSYKDTEEAREYWQNSVVKFAKALEKTFKTKITKKKLLKAISDLNQARKEYRRFFTLRKQNPSVIYGKDAFLVTNSYFFDDLHSWTAALKVLNEELEERVQNGFSYGGHKTPRILFTGSPPIFPNLKLPLLIEESGAILATDEVCSSTRLLYDAPIVGEGELYELLPAIADRYLKPCTCPCFVPNQDRQRKLKDLVEMFQVDGVVYQSLSGCQLYEFEHKPVEKYLKSIGVPMLYVESDYSTEDKGQLSTRVEAFLESIQARKKRRKA